MLFYFLGDGRPEEFLSVICSPWKCDFWVLRPLKAWLETNLHKI